MDEQRTFAQQMQKGIRDRILGDCCESLINTNYEQPSQAAWENLNSLLPGGPLSLTHKRTPEGTDYIEIDGLDYAQFKLFLLSMLWRSSVSSRAEFADVDLGAKHGERIRQMLLGGDPGTRDDYPCALYLLLDEMRAMLPPYKARREGHLGYRFVLPTRVVLWFVVTSDAIIRKRYAGVSLHPSGKWAGVRQLWKDIPEFPQIVAFAKQTEIPDYMLRP